MFVRVPFVRVLRAGRRFPEPACVPWEILLRAQSAFLGVPHADGTLVPTPGGTVAVAGDGAVGLLGVLSAKQMGAGRNILLSRQQKRQQLTRESGATDIVAERGDEAVARAKEMTKGRSADSVLECVGTQESMMQAIPSTRPGPGSALSPQADRSCAEWRDRSRQGFRSGAAAGGCRRGLSFDG